MRILVVENDKTIAKAIMSGIEANNDCQVTLSHDGFNGLKKAETDEFDLVVLDADLPKKDGITVLRELRQSGNHVLTLLFAESTEAVNLVSALDAGADVYVQKSDNLDELQAWIRSLLRRRSQDIGATIRYADMKLDPVNHRAWRDGKEIVLTAKEYAILAYFAKSPGKVLTRQDIADNCWKEPFETFTNIIDVYINYLRRKVDAGFSKKLIHTVRGKGYMFEDRG